MPDDKPRILEIDRIVHEPARLAILTALYSCRAADFLFLQNVTGLSKGNLSIQISRLEEAAMVKVAKTIEKKKTRTRIFLTRRGAAMIDQYWKTMDEIRNQSKR
jgi:DNA-binding MarR family transcriptional regulator